MVEFGSTDLPVFTSPRTCLGSACVDPFLDTFIFEAHGIQSWVDSSWHVICLPNAHSTPTVDMSLELYNLNNNESVNADWLNGFNIEPMFDDNQIVNGNEVNFQERDCERSPSPRRGLCGMSW